MVVRLASAAAAISILFATFVIQYFAMSLIPNKKNKKDNRPSGNAQRNNPGFPAPKGKSNSKSAAKNTRMPGRSNRGS